ncbi:MAG: response regulator [Lachnospiraceae bacterium]|nr:response regulator [Lachnospiraceae bacterium]
MNNKKHAGVIILIASLLLAVTFMNIWMVFGQTRRQTLDSGTYQLEMIGGRLESTIKNAENLVMEIAVAAGEHLDAPDDLKDFIYAKKKELLEQDIGVFNVYIAGDDFAIIPDFDMPDDYVATERVWYTGALRNNGIPYVSPPYIDAMTNDICYTVSVMLSDGTTVVSADYTMDNIQKHIRQMYDTGSHNAVIVTEEGIIAGCADERLTGMQLVAALPDYAGIWNLARNKNSVVNARIKSGLFYEHLFATRAGNGWVLIVSENDWELYKNSYRQLVVTALLSIALFVIVIILYLLAVKNQKRAERALASKEDFLKNITGELNEPLNRILESSKTAAGEADTKELMAGIHSAGERLSETIGQIVSYSSIVRSEKQVGSDKKTGIKGMNKRFMRMIIALMLIIMFVTFYINISVIYKWGNVVMQKEADSYRFRLSEWVDTQKSILDMFVSVIATNPDMLDDYEATVAFLDAITIRYPEISVSYMACPDREPSVYMNNGWVPEPGWRVETRSWYVDLMKSSENWSISSPYYDQQTGGYCITLSEKVYNAYTGEFIGNFGIDFFMDKLVSILGDSYSEKGYAFLADNKGEIINHPFGSYQMSDAGHTNVDDLVYGGVEIDLQKIQFIKDYDNSYKVITAASGREAGFTVYVVADIWSIFGRVTVYGMICFIVFMICIVLIYRTLSDLIRWQDATNRQIKEAADAAIAAGKAKSRFLAQMSHEIRTPINAVLGMNEMILRESDDKNIICYADNIQSAGKNLLSIINSILDFSKIEDGKMEIIPVKYDLASVVNNLVNSISERARVKGLKFNVEVNEQLPSVLYGDDVRITQVIMNLLTNAVKYTEEGEICLKIDEKEREEDKIALEVSVSDTGIGIREEDMGKLFESFERLDEIRNRSIEGTGLGMSIVTKLLNMMDSTLKVESVYGKGSKFSFVLKQTVIDERPVGDYEQRLSRSKEEKGSENHPYVKNASVLVVDDNTMNLTVASNLLKLNGIVPDTAPSGEKAIELIRDRRYDIIFLDHMMPKMDGIETLGILKEKNYIPEGTAVIALTANAVVGARESYLQAGFDDYLSKPIEVEKLEEKLVKYLPPEMISWTKTEKEEKDEDIMEFSPDDDIMEFKPAGEDDRMDNKEILTKLKAAGFDTDAALIFCAGDEDFYTEILGDYADDSAGKTAELDGYLEKEDLKEYKVLVHSLKSSSKTIGATELSEEAKALEDASGKEDLTFVSEHHKAFTDRYKKAAEVIKAILNS